MKNKSVAFIHYEFPFGGAETVTSHISKYLISNGYDIYIFAIRINESKLMTNHAKVNFIKLPNNKINENSDFIIDNLNKLEIDFFVIPTFGFTIPHDIKSRTTCKIIFAHHNMPLWESIFKLENGKNRSKKSFLKKLEWYIFSLPKYKIFCNLNKKIEKTYTTIYNAIDAYAVLCDDYGKEIAKIVNTDYNNSKIVTLINPTIEPKENINLNKKRQIIYVGRLSYADKRVDRLLEIWNLVYQKFPDWELLIIGNGDCENDLKQQAEKLNLGNYTFCGYTPDINHYLQNAAILCLTSNYEGWPLSLTEAQSYGVVPIAFNCCAGVKTILSPSGVNGVLVDPFELDEYANKLSELMSNEALRKEMQQNVLEKAKEYNIENIGKQWENMFEKLKK